VIPVIDVFAGPGGLNEGFSSIRDASGAGVFKTVASIEMEKSAVETLRLRAAIRGMRAGGMGDNGVLQDFFHKKLSLASLHQDADFQVAYKEALEEVHQFELSEPSRSESDAIIRRALGPNADQWVLIGGPPCQAYSLAGRSRRKHDAAFEDDHKHFLYREYLHIIREHRPTVFVMENVKGLLSSVNRGQRMIDLIREDLETPAEDLGYELFSMVVRRQEGHLDATDFLIKAEQYGVPQRRHRVIIVGVRRGSGLGAPYPLEVAEPVSVFDAISSLPALRSKISRSVDDSGLWYEVRDSVTRYVPNLKMDLRGRRNLPPMSTAPPAFVGQTDSASGNRFREFVRPAACQALPTWNHEARGHMVEDLLRYGVLSLMSNQTGISPKVRDLPRSLWPNHNNIDADVVPFEDRFRVQAGDRPATTIVSHIAKDGHYYIHPDPAQMRSFTVREAARLQTFPDDYIFLGSRTQQFTQVGNAVPPLLAKQIGERIAAIFLRPTAF
jgi:DNA (cytosine-5)-methyltransferase 1